MLDKVADLLLLAQNQPGKAVTYAALAARWALKPRMVRRLAQRAVDLAQQSDLGSLKHVHLDGSGEWLPGEPGAVVWTAARPAEYTSRAQAVAAHLAALPFEAAGARDVVSDLGKLAETAVAPHLREDLKELRKRAFYYQPAVVRRVDPEVVRLALEALVLRRPLMVGTYTSPNYDAPQTDVVLEPWTLVHSFDGLYLLGLDRAEPRASAPRRPMALHRMSAVSVDRTECFEIPSGYHPKTYLDHGFGPYLGRPGSTVIFVPDSEWKFVREVEFEHLVGQPREVPGGVEITLGVGFNWGIDRWCRWMGAEIVASDHAPADLPLREPRHDQDASGSRP